MWVLFLFNQSKMVLYAQFLGIGIDMPQISRSALVPSAEQMYKLVNDVISYPSFLPGCVGSRIISHSSEEMTASVEVSKAGISKTLSQKCARG